jgi:uracil-DNA glycosylase
MYQLHELEWYLGAGVDEAISEVTRNYFEVPAVINLPVTPQITTKPIIITQPKLDIPKIASGINSLAELYDIIKNFDGCIIKKSAKNTVIADGNQNADIMIIGDMPTMQDDEAGKPFCGEMGQLLDKMFTAIGLTRNELYLTNTIFWRPPANRLPNSEELMICKPFTEKHIALINPKLLILMGEIAAKTIMNTSDGIMKLRGQHHLYKNPYNNVEYKTAILYHPSYLLRQPSAKRTAWEDLQEIQKLLQGNNNDKI